MRELHLTPIRYLPVITPQDQEFAEQVANDFNLPIEEIEWLVRYVRHEILDDFSEYMKDSRLKETYQKLFSPDTEITGISINTNKGDLKIEVKSALYDLYFKTLMHRIKLNFKETLSSELEYLHALNERALFGMIIMYFNGTSLNDFNKNIVIGKFLIYFNLFEEKPIKTEIEWNDDPTDDQDYKHYLRSIVSSRRRKYSINPNI